MAMVCAALLMASFSPAESEAGHEDLTGTRAGDDDCVFFLKTRFPGSRFTDY